MTISWKCAQHAQKGPTSQNWGLIQHLEIFCVKTEFQFHELYFGMILLCICWELVLGPLIEVEDGSKGYNFHADCAR